MGPEYNSAAETSWTASKRQGRGSVQIQDSSPARNPSATLLPRHKNDLATIFKFSLLKQLPRQQPEKSFKLPTNGLRQGRSRQRWISVDDLTPLPREAAIVINLIKSGLFDYDRPE